MTITEFIEKYKNGQIKKDYDGNYGIQCVDLANSYAQHCLDFGVGVFYGVRYAKQIFDNYNKKLFIREANTPKGVPPHGSLVIWDRGAAGHIALVLKATEHTITVFESNYDGKGSIRTHTYNNYKNVVGWLIPFKKIKTGYDELFLRCWDSAGNDYYYPNNKKIIVCGTRYKTDTVFYSTRYEKELITFSKFLQ